MAADRAYTTNMRLKNNNFNDAIKTLRPEVIRAMFVVDIIWREQLQYELIITSVEDGKHSKRSRHYLGLAFDARTWTTAYSGQQLPSKRRKALLELCKNILGEDWFILDEGTHFHFDYRPLRKGN